MKYYLKRDYLNVLFSALILLFTILNTVEAQYISLSKDSVITVSNQPEALVCADFNDDQFIDIAAVVPDISKGNPLMIFLNNGNGIINNEEDSLYQNSESAKDIVAGDFNNDQIKDIAVSIYQDSTVAIYLGNSDGSFTRGETIEIPTNPDPMFCEDFDNDGKMDLVVGSRGFLIVYSGNGQGSFTEKLINTNVGTVNDIKVADMNGDGYNDIIVGTGNRSVVEILHNDGNGGFPSQNNFVTPYPSGFIEIADFNNDGFLDIVSGSGSSKTDNIVLLLRKNDLEYPCADTISMGKYIRDITVGDFNNDHIKDIAVADQNGLFIIKCEKGKFAAIDTVDIIDGNYYGGRDLKSADVNNDDYLDLIVTRYEKISVYYNVFPTSVSNNFAVPADFHLYQNYPNPFNPITTINYQIAEQSHVILSVYNILGQKIYELVNKKQDAGFYTINFNAASLLTGLYFYRLETERCCLTRKMAIIK